MMSPSAFADEGDAPVVYCLTEGRGAALVNSAVALRLAAAAALPDHVTVGQQALDINAWRDQRPGDFTRACGALFAADARAQVAASGSSFLATFTPFLIALISALATLSITTWRDKIARGRVQADALEAAAGDFHRATNAYLESLADEKGVPSPETVRENRAKLVGKLRPVSVLHPPWKVVTTIQDTLATGPLGSNLTQGWAALKGEPRSERVERLTNELTVVYGLLLQVSRGLVHPVGAFFHRPSAPAKKP